MTHLCRSTSSSFSHLDSEEIRELLTQVKNIAIVGLSDNPERASYHVAAYLQQQGYRIIPINPRVARVLGETAYDCLEDVPVRIDLVNIFRRSEDVPDIVDSALSLRPLGIWMQEGVEHAEAARHACRLDIKVVMNRCILKEHHHLL